LLLRIIPGNIAAGVLGRVRNLRRSR